MPIQKDLKRLVRARMQKTGEAYTAARLQVLRTEPAVRPPLPRDLATLAGMSDASVRRATGRSWREWVRVLDTAGAETMPHQEIAGRVASLGTPSWWTQMVTVGYERIRGLRAKGQSRGGTYSVTKSRTFGVPVTRLFSAWATARSRRAWLPVAVSIRASVPNKSVRLTWEDGTRAQIGFVAKGPSKSVVAVQHERLPDKAAADRMRAAWGEHFDRLGRFLR